MNNYCLVDNLIFNICNSQYHYFLNKANVVGVALGFKRKNTLYSNQKCLTVFVSKKVPEIELSRENLIPNKYRNIDTDVIESGFFNSTSLTSRIRPTIGGYSIGVNTPSPTFGTLGCLVTDGINKFILSCNHVIAKKNIVPLGTPIIQPSSIDGGNIKTDIVATLSKFVSLKFITSTECPENFSDCAIAKITNSKISLSSIAYIGLPKGTKVPKLGETVKKVGRTSEITTGIITNLGAVIELDSYTSKPYLLKEQIITTIMALPGDSGSILLNNDNYAIGLVCGGTFSLTNSSLIDPTLILLGVHILTC